MERSLLFNARSINDLNHNDHLLAILIGDYGYIGATEKLLSTEKIQEGFVTLAYMKDRPDLTIEYLVVNKKFRQLFESAIVEEAERRLNAKQSN